VGIYVDAAPGVVARALTVQTDTQGWTAQVYATKEEPPEQPPDPEDPSGGWERVSSARTVASDRERFDLDTAGQRFRYYLVWITQLPEGEGANRPPGGQVRISEVFLYR
jgi:serine/threonine-protein kinase